MKVKNNILYIIISMLTFLFIFTTVITFANEQDKKKQIQEEFQERIRNSQGVYFYVEVNSQDESDVKSFTDDLQKDIEGQLKNARIQILSKEDSDNMPGCPRLALYLVIYREPSQKNVFLYSFRLVHFEAASLVRSNRLVEGICWDSGLYIGIERRSAIKNKIREHVINYIQDYNAVNRPKYETDHNL